MIFLRLYFITVLFLFIDNIYATSQTEPLDVNPDPLENTKLAQRIRDLPLQTEMPKFSSKKQMKHFYYEQVSIAQALYTKEKTEIQEQLKNCEEALISKEEILKNRQNEITSLLALFKRRKHNISKLKKK